jgi:L-ascorbate metabolism protein UlaG (beta-lactamase superfamily)
VVLVSHNHYDHMDMPALSRLARQSKPLVVTPLGNARLMRRAMPGVEIVELNWGQPVAAGPVRITLVPALHWSKRSLSDVNKALWGAFVIQTNGGIIYFAGDTGFGDGAIFRDVRREFGAPRLSLLPIGAYEPRWFMKAQHMNPEEAVAAHGLLGSGTSLAIHHSTIQLTDEPMDAPARALAQAAVAAQLSDDAFRVVMPGEGVIVP